MIKLVFAPTDSEQAPSTVVSADNLAEAAAALLIELESLYGISSYSPIAVFEALHRLVVLHENFEATKVEQFDFGMPEDSFTLELLEV